MSAKQAVLSPPERMLRRPQVSELTGLSRTAMYDAIKQESFPKQVKIGCRAVAWKASDVQRWIDSRIEAAKV
jgi:prophage regulatory protein